MAPKLNLLQLRVLLFLFNLFIRAESHCHFFPALVAAFPEQLLCYIKTSICLNWILVTCKIERRAKCCSAARMFSEHLLQQLMWLYRTMCLIPIPGAPCFEFPLTQELFWYLDSNIYKKVFPWIQRLRGSLQLLWYFQQKRISLSPTFSIFLSKRSKCLFLLRAPISEYIFSAIKLNQYIHFKQFSSFRHWYFTSSFSY